METEKRLIDANALLTEIERIYKEHYEQSCYQFIHDFFRAIFRRIRKAPTVDAVEVVHGRWIQDGVYDCCSVCNKVTIMPHLKGLPHFNYCPNCGAKMDGDGNG